MRSVCAVSISIFFVFLSAAVFFCEPAAAAETVSLSVNGKMLSADVHNTPLKKVLAKLSAECGAAVYLDESLQDKTVSIKLENEPIENAVKRLAAPYNSAVIFSQRQTSSGEKEFYISNIKVFESGKGGNYVNVSLPDTPPADSPGEVRKQIKDPWVRDVFDMLINSVEEESRIKEDISRLESDLSKAGTEDEKRKLREELSQKNKLLRELDKKTRLELEEKEKALRLERVN
jgi:hypothetical protein